MKKNKDVQYYVRKSWDDIESQIGIEYSFLANAKKACDKAEGYAVFDSQGKQVYPENNEQTLMAIADIEIGATIRLLPNVTYSSGKRINSQLFNTILYILDADETSYAIGHSKDGPKIGRVNKESVELVFTDGDSSFNTFVIQVLEDNTPLYNIPNNSAKIINYVNKYALFTIINEKDGFGKIKQGPGWIQLNQAYKLV